MTIRILAFLATVGTATLVTAQQFPPEGDWVPLPCVGGAMTDGYQDETGALGPRDIVGDQASPAGYRALDGEFLFLRLRLDEDPAPGGTLRPFSWGFELDTDGDLTTYEVLLLVNGTTEEVAVYANAVTTQPDDPTDPADEPPVATYPAATHVRAVAASGSTFGGNPDAFLDFAVPWADLNALGLTASTSVSAWAASSSTSSSLNGDFACHDGALGDPSLSGSAPDPVVIDTGDDSDNDGYSDAAEIAAGTDPYDPLSYPGSSAAGPLLEGGGGCAVVPGTARGGNARLLLPLLALLASLAGRRRSATNSRGRSSAR